MMPTSATLVPESYLCIHRNPVLGCGGFALLSMTTYSVWSARIRAGLSTISHAESRVLTVRMLMHSPASGLMSARWRILPEGAAGLPRMSGDRLQPC
jgi:hypothetical protein